MELEKLLRDQNHQPKKTHTQANQEEKKWIQFATINISKFTRARPTREVKECGDCNMWEMGS